MGFVPAELDSFRANVMAAQFLTYRLSETMSSTLSNDPILISLKQ